MSIYKKMKICFIFEFIFGVIMIAMMIIFEGNYFGWTNDYPIVYIPFIGFIISGIGFIYYALIGIKNTTVNENE